MTLRKRCIVAMLTAAAIAGPAASAYCRAPLKQGTPTRHQIEKKPALARQQTQLRLAEMRLVGRLATGH